MSIYSGKCDFADTVSIYGVDEILSKYDVRHITDNGTEAVEFNGDLRLMIPWYPYIIGAMSSSAEGGTIWLSRYPYPYEECMNYWQWVTKRFKGSLKYHRQKARKFGYEFDEERFIEKFVKSHSAPWSDDPLLREVCEKLVHKKRGEKINYPLTRSARFYMTCLCDEMTKNGLDPAEYGYVVEDGKVVNFDELAK